MSHAIELSNGLIAVVGLDWQSVPVAEFSRVRKDLRSQGLSTCIFEAGSNENSKMVSYGTVESVDIPFDAQQRKGVAVSLAGLLAVSNPGSRIIAVESVPGDEPLFWFCAINNGQVVSDSDVVGPWDVIERKVSRYTQLMSDDADTLIGDQAGRIDNRVRGEALLDYINESMVGAATVKSLKGGVNPLLVIAAIAGIAAMVSSFFLMSDDNPKSNRLTPAQIQAKQQAQAQAGLKQAISSIGQTSDMSVAIRTIYQQKISALPNDVLGWGLDSIECSQGICKAAYSNAGLSPVKSLRDAVGSLCNLEVGTLGKKATCSLSLNLDSIDATLSDIKYAFMGPGQFEHFRDSLMTLGRGLPDTAYRIEAPESLSFAGSNFLDQSEIPQAGEFGVVSRIKYLPEVMEMLSSNIALGYTAAKFKLSDGTVEISGNYYAQGGKQ